MQASNAATKRGGRVLRLVIMCLVAGAVVGQTGCVTTLPSFIHSGFKVGPNYTPPPAPEPKPWQDEKDPRVHQGNPNLASWWETFDDPLLTDLLHRTTAQNLTLKAAGLQILQARIQRNIARTELLPQSQFISSQYTRGASSLNAGGFGPNRFFTSAALAGSLSWELDFWGLFRRNIESANAALDQSAFDYDEMTVLLLANVATDYVEYRTLQKRIQLARKNVAQQEPLVKMYKERFEAGKATANTGYFQLKANLDNTKALIPPLEIALRLANNQLCVLMGIPVQDLTSALGDGTVPDRKNPAQRHIHIPWPKDESVVVGIPADLLLKRPDVLAAERQLRIQSAQIGVAEAEMFPHIGINGTIGLSSSQLVSLFSPNAWNGTIGPSLTWNILNYGRLLANVRIQNVIYQQNVLNYQNAILTANQDAENAMVAYLKSLDEVKHVLASAESSTKLTDILLEQWRAQWLGAGANLDTGAFINQLFTAFNFQVQQQDAAAQAEGNVALNLILLYRAMGGGWQINEATARVGLGFREAMSNCQPENTPPPAWPGREGGAQAAPANPPASNVSMPILLPPVAVTE